MINNQNKSKVQQEVTINAVKSQETPSVYIRHRYKVQKNKVKCRKLYYRRNIH